MSGRLGQVERELSDRDSELADREAELVEREAQCQAAKKELANKDSTLRTAQITLEVRTPPPPSIFIL